MLVIYRSVYIMGYQVLNDDRNQIHLQGKIHERLKNLARKSIELSSLCIFKFDHLSYQANNVDSYIAGSV